MIPQASACPPGARGRTVLGLMRRQALLLAGAGVVLGMVAACFKSMTLASLLSARRVDPIVALRAE